MSTSRSAVARRAMVDAAEVVVTERGLAAMALSEVQQRAGQSNKSAARYHFGSREGLIVAVLEERMGPVDTRRRQLLNDLAAPLTTAQVACVLVRPLAAQTLERPGSRYARFLMQIMVDPRQVPVVLEHLRASSFRDLRDMYLAGSTLPADLAETRFASAVSLCVATLATWEGHRRRRTATAAIVDDLVHICTAVLDAPAAATSTPPIGT